MCFINDNSFEETTTMLRITLACTMGLFVICSADAQSGQGVPGDLKNFVRQFVAATNAKDVVRLRLVGDSGHGALTPRRP